MDWLIPALTTLLASAGGFGGALQISKRERHDAELDEVRGAYSSFLAAVYTAVAELRGLPPAEEPGKIAKALDSLGSDQQKWVQQQKDLARLGGRVWIVSDRVTLAWAQLQVLPVPDRVRAAAQRATDYVERLAESREEAVTEEWPEVHAELSAGAAELAEHVRRPRILTRLRTWLSGGDDDPASLLPRPSRHRSRNLE